ncbi:ROK family protein [Ghiorsea bivora]|uniref:ROK family protein n=1 Tax=Ghiorsea bivora TaxID=1485545 RepID=UPI0005719235|nr:ROK family protein [Ghiorsea bivora]
MTNAGDVLAADIGGTNLRLARVQAGGHIVQEVRVQTQFSQLSGLSSEAAAQAIVNTISQAAKPLLDVNIIGLGIGFPGFFMGDSGILASSPNIPQLHNFKLAESLSQQLSMPVFAQNDALCAAIGEQSFGAGKGMNNLLHITLGTGIGGGLILNNQPYTGESGMAMEFGHLRVEHDDDARLCGCGHHGCVEAYASATAISTRYAEISGEKLETKVVFERAMQGNKEAKAIIESAGTYLGRAIAEAIKLLDIHTVTISGGLIGAWDMLHPSMMNALNAQLIPPQQNKVRILPSALKDNAGLLGASSLIKYRV